MATIDELERQEDLVSKIQSGMAEAANSGKEFARQMGLATKDTLKLDDVLEHIVRTSTDLDKTILTSRDLQKQMLTSSKDFAKVQEKILKIGKQQVDAVFDKEIEKLNERIQLSEKTIDIDKEMAQIAEDRATGHSLMNKDLDRQLKILKRQQEVTTKLDVDAKSLVDSLGSMIRDPAAGADKVLGKLSSIPSKLMEAKKQTGSWGGAMKSVASGSGLGKFVKMIKKGGPIVLGLLAITAAAVVMFKLFKNFWTFLDKNVVPAIADFNKEVGGSGASVQELKGQMVSAGVQFELLGMSFQEGTKLVRDLSAGLRTVEISPDVLKTGMELQAILGLTGQEVGKLSLQFTKNEGNLDSLNRMMAVGAKEAEKYGIPVNVALKDLAGAPDIMARFGVANSAQFAKSTVKAQSYGLAIRDVNRAFGDQLDTFENSADAAAKLNAVFGTNINSLELMLETDPTKRMELLRKELLAQGKSWEKLNVFEKNMISTTLGVEKSQAALILSSDKERKKLEAAAAIRERNIKLDEKWNRGISSIKRTLIAWGKEIDLVMRNTTTLVFTMLGFEKPGKVIDNIVKGLGKGFRNLNKWLKNTAKHWDKPDKLSKWGKILRVTASVVKVLWAGLKTFFKILGLVAGKISDVLGFTDLWNASMEGLGISSKAISDILPDMIKWLDEWADSADDINWDEMWDGMVMALDDAWKSIKKTFTSIFTFVVEKSKIIGETLLANFSEPFESLKTAGEFWSNIVGGIFNEDEGATKTARRSPKKVQDFKSNLPKATTITPPNGQPIQLAANDTAIIASNKGGAMGGQPQIVHVHLHMDGKEILDTQVRLAKA